MSSKQRPACIAAVIMMAMLLANAAQAETGYVTDMLQLDLYADKAMSGKAIRKLRSGDRFEVLQRDGRAANVRLPDGQKGWVKSLYIVTKEPARTRVNQLEDQNAALQKQVDSLQAELTSGQSRIAQLEGRSDGAEAERAAVAAELAELRERNAELERTVSGYGSSVPLSIFLLGAVLALAVGAFSGWYYVDSRSRARHGGYRIY